MRTTRSNNGTLVQAAAAVDDGAATQITLTFDDNRLASLLLGQYGQHLALIERRLGVVADQRGNHVTVAGSRDACEQAGRWSFLCVIAPLRLHGGTGSPVNPIATF